MNSEGWFESKGILQDTSENARRRSRQRKCSMDDVEEWTCLPMPELEKKKKTDSFLQKRLEEDLY